ncbi:MAG: transporter substrate-binding domain-containing protein [Methylobacteriaceae bacterium]|nr:transporter substrate-binding domain-containing protein [Methylobacteriaceae bacterium]
MAFIRTIGLAAAAILAATSFATAQPKSITIATEGAYAPWNFTEANGKLAGYEIELAADLCKRMKIECKVIAQDWDGIIPALNAGKYDAIMAGMSITDKRKEAINFSDPYGSTPNGFVVPKSSPLAKLPGTGSTFSLVKDADAAKKSIEEMKALLKGKKVGVQVSTTNAAFIEKYFKGTVDIREYKTTEQHDLDLQAGRIDATFAAMSYQIDVVKKADFKDYALAGATFSGEVLGLGVGVGLRKADTQLQGMFNEAIKAAIADGTIKTMSTKWFGFDITPK